MYLGIRAYSAVLPKGLYYYNLLLLERPSYFNVTACYRVSVEFYLGFKRGIIDINKGYK